MLIHYDIQKINELLHVFYSATGSRVDLFDNSFTPVSYSQHEMCNYCRNIQRDPRCKKACVAFDKTLIEQCKRSQKSEQALCPFGLLNIVSPILYNGTAIGYLFFGQMKTAEAIPDCPADLQADYSALSPFTISQSQSIARLAEIMIGHILTENMLKPDTGEVLQKAVAYIEDNLCKDLSVKELSKGINASKSVLYKKFSARFHCTIGEYINKKRVKRSVELLTTTSLSMEEISQQCGFSSASYFTRIFKEHMGVTPLKFRKSQQ